jgi:hypothetical protein
MTKAAAGTETAKTHPMMAAAQATLRRERLELEVRCII